MKTPEQELDSVYHAIPEWVHRSYPDKSLSEKLVLGFEELGKLYTDSVRDSFDRKKNMQDFATFLVQDAGKDFGSEYWRYLMSKRMNGDKKKS